MGFLINPYLYKNVTVISLRFVRKKSFIFKQKSTTREKTNWKQLKEK